MAERLQTVLILTGLAALAALVGVTLAGTPGLMVALGTIFLLWVLAPQVPNAWVLNAVRAQPLRRGQAPDLQALHDALAARAGLARSPTLYVWPERRPQAFTIGERNDAAIVVSIGLTRILSRRELGGVLAHELTHVAHDDIRLLRFAGTLSYVTAALSRAAVVAAVITLPLILLGIVTFAPSTLLVVLLAPLLAQALLLALSRTREHAADAGAVRLTGDPAGLASALARLHAQQQSLWERLLGVRAPTGPQWLQTHPATEERIRRLMGGASSRTSRSSGAAHKVLTSRPRRARIVVRRGPRTTILRAV